MVFGAGLTGIYRIANWGGNSFRRAIILGARLLLVTAQMHFIFLDGKNLVLAGHVKFARPQPASVASELFDSGESECTYWRLPSSYMTMSETKAR